MNYKSLTTLEYDKIIDRLVSFAASDKAKERLKKLVPMTDIHDINAALSETSDALSRVYAKGAVSFSGVHDVGASVKRLEIGSSLNTVELLHISSLLTAAARVKNYYEDTTDSLTGYFHALEPLTPLNTEIKRCILSEDEISDDASANLRSIRRQKVLAAERIHTELNKMLNSSSVRNCLQDFVITSRSGRYCLPVKAEYKSQVPGMVHDQSATGSTLFIEPAAVVKLNNDIRELELKEQAEIEAILAELSAKASEFTDELLTDFQVLTTLDFIFAKAQMSKQYKCSCPVMNTNNYINIKKGRHPLIDPHKVVPIDIYLGKNFNLLIITGPNTGGKTVALKTLGLFVLMNQSGIEIPCDFGSSLPVFDAVLPDIGDEQSIEQSLSTFSSHMVNIVTIIEQTTNRSLCLFDELGAGTDPTEGAALAIAIIEEEKKNGAVVAATTHYAEIKQYALETEGVINASCEFDVETLKPTYRLIVGLPGKSNAFAISLRLGIPEHIIERAKAVMSDDNVRFEDVITRLQDTESRLSKEKKNAEQLKAEAEKKLAEAETLRKVAEDEAAKAVQKAKEQANRILISAKASSEYILDEVNELKRKAEKEKNFDTLEEARRSIRKTLKETNVESEEAPEDDYVPPRPFRVGDTVMIAGINKEAYITALDGDSATVQAGIIKTKVKTSELRLKDKPVQQQPKKTTLSVSRNSAPAKQEIDVRGQTGDDAYFMIDRFFDSAIMANYHVVTIIHGKGTGALRAAIWAKLRKDKRVKSFRSGSYGEGDFGVTVVEL